MTVISNSELLRKQLRFQRQSLSKNQKRQHAQSAQKHLITFLSSLLSNTPKKALRMAFFIAQDGELETLSAIQMLWQSTSHQVFLPVLQTEPDGHMVFAEYTQNSPMKKNKFGILEPIPPQTLLQSGETMDIVLTPLVGFDALGNRLGMGGGYYDRTFKFKQQSSKISPPLLIGWAHSCQQVEQLPVNPWDIPLNGMITEKGFTDFSNFETKAT